MKTSMLIQNTPTGMKTEHREYLNTKISFAGQGR